MGSVLLGGLVRGEIAREKNRFFGHILPWLSLGRSVFARSGAGEGLLGGFRMMAWWAGRWMALSESWW